MSVYLDHAASSPLRPEARAAWLYAQERVGNASSIHGDGQAARRLLEESRERVAAALDAEPVEVVFTSGGTEAVNLAVAGLWQARAVARGVVVLPDGEHHATIDAVRALPGAVERPVAIDAVGRIDPDAFGAALGDDVAVATALVANNEIGTVNDASRLAAVAGAAGVPLHLDAVAAFGHVPVAYRAWRSDATPGTGLVALSVSAHKVGGPVGVGALVVARSARLEAQLHGGGQQRGLRAGTQDVAGAAAFAVAAELAVAELHAEAARLRTLACELRAAVAAIAPDAVLLGDPDDRVPGNVHLLFPGVRGETLLFLLDVAGVSVSTGSACQAGVAEPSHVVLALGRSDDDARAVLRVTLGRTSSAADVAAFAAALPDALVRARAAASIA
ncbi:MAG: aminotransferase class V-fold PLP-dependent enzyme [Microbacterium sp.]|uniref:Cysteine desulfurase n=2 Tax=Microbacterium ginsengisoli TaxID=400772 RepID=A0A0F0LPZ5_9MICO|nr:aminotransferase class V-fold PLP-dependent enzyme [Microbacterium ginsengisoli]KJL35287.1 Cysteine desulfurase [Microbacterium ginsengisoli]MAL05850.1 aminotransferase class V-fold PLP-dependent enzyme [Microbacterium sp.]MBN9208698.1 aminotransferase class V-fold PLP-dependent enzyme [Microbacterium ginsengisoli]